MFTSIVVPTDLSPTGDRAVPIACSLGSARGVRVEVVTVTRPGTDASDWEVKERAAGECIGSTPLLVLHDESPAAAITEHVSGRDGALLVLASTAKAAIDEDHAGSVSEIVLDHVRQPVLMVGPNVDVERGLVSPIPVVCVDGSELTSAVMPVVVSWIRTFGGGHPRAVEVLPYVPAIAKHAGRSLESTRVRRMVRRLAEFGVDAEWEVLYGQDAATPLVDYVERVDNAILVVTSERWRGAGTHWRATSRELVYRSTRPVLIVPADDAA